MAYSCSVTTLPYDCRSKLIVNTFRLFSARNGSFIYHLQAVATGIRDTWSKVDAGIMRHLRHLCFPLKTDASEFLCEIMNA